MPSSSWQRTTALALVLLLCLATSTFILSATAQDESSTGEEPGVADSSTAAAAPVSSTAAATSATSSTGSSSSTGTSPPPVLPSYRDGRRGRGWGDRLAEYRCGNQTNMTQPGRYFDGTQWEDNGPYGNGTGGTTPNYLELPEVAGERNGTIVEKLYPQCYGLGRGNNCLEKMAQFPDPKLGSYVGGLYCNTGKAGGRDFVKGETTEGGICIVFGGNNRLYKMQFFPLVDQFALLTMQNSFSDPRWGHIGTTFQVEVNGNKSPVKHRYNTVTSSVCVDRIVNGTRETCELTGGTICAVVPFHTLIIHMKNGVIEEIEFDDDCSLCSADHCVDGNCATDITSCTATSVYDKTNTAGETDCDFKVRPRYTHRHHQIRP